MIVLIQSRQVKWLAARPAWCSAQGGSNHLLYRRKGGTGMEDRFRIDQEKAVLVIIEVQTALVRAMDPEVMGNVLRNLQVLISFARELGIPMMATEQYPKGLGQTVPEIKQAWGPVVPLEKMAFSCCRVEAFNEKLQQLGRRQERRSLRSYSNTSNKTYPIFLRVSRERERKPAYEAISNLAKKMPTKNASVKMSVQRITLLTSNFSPLQ